MIFINCNLLGGIISLVIDTTARILKYIYKVLKFFHLRLLFTILLAGAIFELLFKALSENATYLIVFLTGTGLSVLRIFYIAVRQKADKLSPQNSQPQQPHANYTQGAVNYPQQDAQSMYAAQPMQNFPPQSVQAVYPNSHNAPDAHFAKQSSSLKKPKYYRVLQNPRYVMAEHNDRYELYFETNNELKLVKTDYKPYKE